VTAAASADHNVPAVAAGELQTLLTFLDYLRDCVDRKLDGVSEDAARRSPVASGTCLLGLVKHLASVEAYWAQRRLAGMDIALADDGFLLADDDDVASVRRAYALAASQTNEIVITYGDPDRLLARSTHGLTLRWMLTHLLEETARHAGHADILRELIDGHCGR
jgi:hypothetical protein